jgi:hypothetical protein
MEFINKRNGLSALNGETEDIKNEVKAVFGAGDISREHVYNR